MKSVRFVFFLLFLLRPVQCWGHGVSVTEAKITLRPSAVIDLQIRFDLVHFLNDGWYYRSLKTVANLSDEEFQPIYNEVVERFKKELLVKVGGKPLPLHLRLPTQQQVQEVLKRQLIDLKLNKGIQNPLYTYYDRQFFQRFFFDFRLPSKADISNLTVTFPAELGMVHVTYIESADQKLPPGEQWTYHPVETAAERNSP